ncbi:MAG: universal stress protein [Desulfonatronovibrio sp.]
MDFKKILVAVDASENSARAVEYTGTMVGKSGDFNICLLYVEHLPERDIYPDEKSWKDACEQEKRKVSNFLENAQKMLAEKDVNPESVSIKYVSVSEQVSHAEHVQGRGVSFHIMRVQKEGGFGTVVVGRRGVSKAEEFLFGSVSTKIIHHGKDCTVWVVE